MCRAVRHFRWHFDILERKNKSAIEADFLILVARAESNHRHKDFQSRRGCSSLFRTFSAYV